MIGMIGVKNMKPMNKEELEKWYDDNMGEFDQEQNDVIEWLIEKSISKMTYVKGPIEPNNTPEVGIEVTPFAPRTTTTTTILDYVTLHTTINRIDGHYAGGTVITVESDYSSNNNSCWEQSYTTGYDGSISISVPIFEMGINNYYISVHDITTNMITRLIQPITYYGVRLDTHRCCITL